jgi:hypothetical protein
MSDERAPRFDVAISFLSRDLRLAETIRNELQPGLTCFVYSRHQEDVAGRDGLEQFRQIFRHDARLNVVLYRGGWGETPWTAVEEKAIEGSALHSRFRTLFLVQIEKEATLPVWVPETLINLQFAEFGLDGIVGAIKSRALELNANFRTESTLELATRLHREHANSLRRKSKEISNEALESGLEAAKAVLDEAGRICEEIVRSVPNPLKFEKRSEIEGTGYVQLNWVRVNFWWEPDTITSVGASSLRVDCTQAELSGAYSRNWKDQGKAIYYLRLSESDEWLWTDRKGKQSTPRELADLWVQFAIRRALTSR